MDKWVTGHLEELWNNTIYRFSIVENRERRNIKKVYRMPKKEKMKGLHITVIYATLSSVFDHRF